MEGPKGFRRKGSWLLLRVGSFSLHLGHRFKSEGVSRLRYVPLVYWRQGRRFPRVKGGTMFSPERAAECKRLIYGAEA